MPKIKNWSRNDDTPFHTGWKHDKDSDQRVIIRAPRSEGGRGNRWLVQYRRTDKQKNITMAPTKEVAMKRAVNWMEDHPNGLR